MKLVNNIAKPIGVDNIMRKILVLFFFVALFQIKFVSAAGVLLGEKLAADTACLLADVSVDRKSLIKQKKSGSSKQAAKSNLLSKKLVSLNKKYRSKNSKYKSQLKSDQWTVAAAVDYVYASDKLIIAKTFKDFCVARYIATH